MILLLWVTISFIALDSDLIFSRLKVLLCLQGNGNVKADVLLLRFTSNIVRHNLGFLTAAMLSKEWLLHLPPPLERVIAF